MGQLILLQSGSDILAGVSCFALRSCPPGRHLTGGGGEVVCVCGWVSPAAFRLAGWSGLSCCAQVDVALARDAHVSTGWFGGEIKAFDHC